MMTVGPIEADHRGQWRQRRCQYGVWHDRSGSESRLADPRTASVFESLIGDLGEVA